MRDQYQLLIGGLGDDAHSIGIGLLALGFRDAGFNVLNLGIRNRIGDFYRWADRFDIIMISNKNGHAEIYLQDFEKQLNAFNLGNDNPKLWYLGGSLSVSMPDHLVKKKFLDMGFTNVYPKTVGFWQILDDVKKDIVRFGIPKRNATANQVVNMCPPLDYSALSDTGYNDYDLQMERKQVLQEWYTGKEVKLDQFESARYPLDQLLWARKTSQGHILLQPRTGVADITEQINKLQTLEMAGSNISSVQLDAACRSKLYAEAKEFRDISIGRKASALNGFPVPVYGVAEMKRLVNSLATPFQLRAGGPDHRFTYEIALQAGVSGLEGGAICYLMPYDKLTSPVTSIKNWQYIDRLCALYEQHTGIAINREYFGVLTAALIAPSLAIVVNIIQALLSAQQGIKSISPGYAEQGNRVQDIAAVRVLEERVNHYLRKSGFRDCRVTTVFHQYMAAFPSDYVKSEELILHSCITACLSGATKVMVKTAAESSGIPTTEDNINALAICKKAISIAKDINVNREQVGMEMQLIRQEVDQIMRCILDLGGGSVSVGVVKAIEQGILDICWSPNVYNKNQVVCIRDIDGAIRFLDFGNLPFSERVKTVHYEKTLIRKNMERDPSLFSLLEKDLSRIWKNDYKQWPLDATYVV
jgi:methylaspartate mutase epsilon subunit